MIDTEDKVAWCQYGDQKEMDFLVDMFQTDLSVMRNPAKAKDKYAHDIFLTLPSDIKTIRTEFRTADRYGFDPSYAFTINQKDVERYQKYHYFVVVLDIFFPWMESRQIRIAPLDRILHAISTGKAKLHAYQNRVEDSSGNAKESWVMDSRWFSLVNP